VTQHAPLHGGEARDGEPQSPRIRPAGIRESVPHMLERLGIAVTELVERQPQGLPGHGVRRVPRRGARRPRFHRAGGGAARRRRAVGSRSLTSGIPALGVPNAGVAGLKTRIGEIAAHVYGEPSRALHMVGITGTNGKTSVAHWIAQCLTQLGRKTAIIGTVGNGFPPVGDQPGALTPALNTTPDAIELQQRLAHYRQQGATACAMEVSSHGLAQGRVNGTNFNVAVLTNLSRDHLDYHGDMDNYAAAKARLFSWPGLEWVVVNVDDAFGQQLEARPGRRASPATASSAAPWWARKLRLSQGGLHLAVRTDWGTARSTRRCWAASTPPTCWPCSPPSWYPA
jgi:UDP-N-acetylmuramoyl-L-alanyl-D-glutamate--2,6-diaminopimelate ligase